MASGGALVRSRFVGRGAEIGELRAEWRQSRANELRCVVLEGEPGIGKTRLAYELLGDEGHGAVVLVARGYPLGAASSFGLWAEALEWHLRDLPPAAVAELCGDALDDLAVILRSARVAGGEGATDAPAVRLREAVAVLVRSLARRRPVVMLLDDLHLADTSSWEALDYVTHNLRDERVLVLGCIRPGELGGVSAAKQILFRLEQEGILRRLSVGPLDRGELDDLAQGVLSRREVPSILVHWLEDRSGGNPLFAVGLLDALAASGQSLSEPSLEAIPRQLGDRLATRLTSLDDEAREVLEHLAVVARCMDLAELRDVGGWSVDHLAEVLDILVEARLVNEQQHGRRIAFEIAHPLMQETIYERLGLARRRSLHRRIGRALRDADHLGEAASHLARAADVGDDEAIRALADVAQQAWSRKAYREAFLVVSTMLELIPPGDERSLDALDVLSPGGEWLFYEHKEDLDTALGVRIMRGMQRILEGSSADPARMAALNLYLSVFLGWGNGDLAESLRRGHQAVDLFHQAGQPELARLAAHEVSWLYGVDGDFAAQEEACRRVVEEAEAAGDDTATIMGLISLSTSLWPRGCFAETEAIYRRTFELSSAQDNLSLIVQSHMFRAMVLGFEGRLAEATTALEAAAVADPEGREPLVIEVGLLLDLLAGDVGRAVDQTRQAAIGIGMGQSWVMLVGALAALERGTTVEAAGYLETLAAVMADRRYWLLNLPFDWASGLHAWCRGDAEAAVGRLGTVARDLVDIDAVAFAPLVLLDLAEVAVETGRVETAQEAAAHVALIAERLDRDHLRAFADLTAGWAAVATGQHHEAVERSHRAATHFRKVGYRLYEARSLDLAARAVAAVDPTLAPAAFQSALGALESCGAGWRRARTSEALASLGRRGRRALAVLDGPRPLTRREREVAELAVDGLTAREIAERLYIGVRTVETHLANIYAKVGVRSRVELLRRAGELTP